MRDEKTLADCGPYGGDSGWKCLEVALPSLPDKNGRLRYTHTLYAYVKEAYIERRYIQIKLDSKTFKPGLSSPLPRGTIIYEAPGDRRAGMSLPYFRGTAIE
ncbi:hypothetical protein NB640_12125 [Oxalobacter vibrioformis]|uniref:Uncharacterized protein n=1 Tax=Oxalobacter vibrioformis TaxID=933080 RepID=A0A9E9LVJ3_9BURK|nr:hypothetical protein [Oxalobacter vibrioformis]WAW09951.1 hypothetical protein NB640_12125 [Oxalobacter vibrioformis]